MGDLVLYNVANNLGGFSIGVKKFLTLLSLLLDIVVFVEELLEQALLVQLRDESVLYDILAVVDEEVHDSLGNLVNDGLADNVEVRRDQGPNELSLHGLAVSQGRLM